MVTVLTYAEQWQDYRRRRRWFRAVFLATALFWLGGGQALFPGLFASEHSTEVVAIVVLSAVGGERFLSLPLALPPLPRVVLSRLVGCAPLR